MIKFDDPRRWKQRADGSMVPEDRAATANLPKDVINPTILHNDAILDNTRIPPMGSSFAPGFAQGYAGHGEATADRAIFMASVRKVGRL